MATKEGGGSGTRLRWERESRRRLPQLTTHRSHVTLASRVSHNNVSWALSRAQRAFGEPILSVKVSELGRLEGASAQGITILNLQLIKLNCKGDPDILQGLGRSAIFRQQRAAPQVHTAIQSTQDPQLIVRPGRASMTLA